MSPPAPSPSRQHGAALLLLLLLLGLAAAGLLINVYGRDNGQAERESDTLRQLSMAKSALLGYAQLKGNLPSPATSAADGLAAPQACADNTPCTGYLPWATLGISGIDSWGKMLRYSVTPVLTRAPILRLQAVADRRILTRDSNGALTYHAGNANCSTSRPCVAAVIFSYGKNNFGTSSIGIQQANGATNNIDEMSNNVATRDFISRPATRQATMPGGEFDDLVVWIPLPELYLHMNQAGKLP